MNKRKLKFAVIKLGHLASTVYAGIYLGSHLRGLDWLLVLYLGILAYVCGAELIDRVEDGRTKW